MSQFEKLLERVMKLDPSLRFGEVEKVLLVYGYQGKYPKGGSSHCTFRKEGCPPITIPKHQPIGIAYIRLVRDILEREGKDE